MKVSARNVWVGDTINGKVVANRLYAKNGYIDIVFADESRETYHHAKKIDVVRPD